MIEQVNQPSEEMIHQLMAIWLKTNQEAHPFVAASYWLEHEEEVKEQLPNATLFITKEGDKIEGFLGLQKGYIAGLFVEKRSQGKGLGRQLLNKAKKEAAQLTLAVYKKNEQAYHFYISQGFQVIKEQVDEETDEVELILQWTE